MHLQQTKAESRMTGGPQYYFHDVPDPVKDFFTESHGLSRGPSDAIRHHKKSIHGGRSRP